MGFELTHNGSGGKIAMMSDLRAGPATVAAFFVGLMNGGTEKISMVRARPRAA